MKKSVQHWWKSGCKSDVARGLRITLSNGEPGADDFAFFDYARAAFCYEHDARVKQDERKAKSPCYRFKKPFPELAQSQKDLLKDEFPPRGWALQPWERSKEMIPFNLSDEPPTGWIDIHFWVDPSKTDKGQVLKTIGDFFEAKKKAMGFPKHPKHGIRREPYPWKSLEKIDAFLSGAPQEDYDKSHARLVLRTRKNNHF